MAALSVSMCPASEMSAKLPDAKPPITSITMKVVVRVTAVIRLLRLASRKS